MKISIVQLNYIVANFSYNFDKISKAMHLHKDSEIIVFSELCIIGYYPYDLLYSKKIINEQNKIVQQIKKLTYKLNTTVIIGVANIVNGYKKYYNSALVISCGNIIHCYNKQLIPSYEIFDESRHFISGKNDKLTFTLNKKKFAILICEDLWYSKNKTYIKDPLNDLAYDLDALIILNASPSVIEKFNQRLYLVSNIAKKINAPVFYSSQVGGYDALVYDGASFICNANGDLIALAKEFEEDSLTITLNNNRCCSSINYYLYKSQQSLILRQLMCGLFDYVHKCGFKGAVVGCSGGIDSALTLAIAMLSLGKENVKAITMPSIYSSEGSINDSIELCRNLDVELFVRDIKDDFLLACTNFRKSFGKSPEKLTQENMQARIRGRIVMEYSNDSNLLMIATGNKSELAVGYTTVYGDMCGAINCIGDLYKGDVYTLSRFINNKYGQIIPQNIIDKFPSAELSEGQKDSDNLPDYYYLDALLKLYLEGDLLQDSELCSLKSIVSKIDMNERNKIIRMVELAEFKRKQSPPIICVTRRPFGIGRRMPVAKHILVN